MCNGPIVGSRNIFSNYYFNYYLKTPHSKPCIELEEQIDKYTKGTDIKKDSSEIDNKIPEEEGKLEPSLKNKES